MSVFVGNEAANDVDAYDPTGTYRGSFPSTFDVADGFAVGDLDGDDVDEIVIANDIDHVVHVYTQSGQSLGFFLSVFDTADGFAVGDVDGDRRDEIVVGNDLTHDIVIYRGDGTPIRVFSSSYDTDDGFAVGDVNGDGAAEIIVANNVTNDIDIYDLDGNTLGAFGATFNLGDGLAAGDVNGDGLDEIVIASIIALGDDVFVYDLSGNQLQSFNGGFDAQDRLAVGEVTADFTDEILIANNASGLVRVYSQSGSEIDSFNTSFDGLDGFAVSSRNLDIDQDGIPDRIELNGLFDFDGNLVADFPAWGADPCRKSIAIEIDYMDGAADGHTHRPLQAALDEVTAAFGAAPIAVAASCPYVGFPKQISGINLLLDVDDALPEQEALDFPDFNVGLDDWANANMQPERRPYFHYALFGHDIETGSSVSGRCCGVSGKDFVVTLGRWTGDVGSVREQSGTFMHELGHALGLGHGGADTNNYKPNYLSVMNYHFQTAGLTDADTGVAAIDYSRANLATLNESALDETAGLGAGPLLTLYHDSNLVLRTARGDGPIDWDFDTAGVAPFEAPPPGVPVDLNRTSFCVSAGGNGVLDTTPAGDDVVVGTAIAHGPDMTCDTARAGDDGQVQAVGDSLATFTALAGQDDWANVKFRALLSPDAGVDLDDDEHDHELTYEEALEIHQFWHEISLAEDAFERNDTPATATILGSLPEITLRDLTIRHLGPDGLNSSDEQDLDFFKYRAHDTGLLSVNIYFDGVLGQLDLRVRDKAGNILATGTQSNLVPGLDGEALVIPVVTQEDYFIEVFSGIGDKNAYSLEIENFAAPVPIAVDLAAADDSGSSDSDNVTFHDEGTVTILADLQAFGQQGIGILTPAQVAAQAPGAAVEVFVRGQFAGFAAPLAGSNDTLFTFQFTPGQLSEGLNFVTAAVRVFDGQDPQQQGRTQLSAPLLLTLDTTAPAGPLAPDLLAASDSGFLNDDNVTAKTEPTLAGATERNARIRLRADGVVVGVGVATSSGQWQVSTKPLRDGVFEIRAEAEDLAGNVSPLSAALRVEIDTLAPNLPLLDLLEPDDSGRHNDDNITNVNRPRLSATTQDPNSATHILPANLHYRIFDRLEQTAEVLLFDSVAVSGGLTSLTQVFATADLLNGATLLGPLADGIHNLKLEIEDRAGNRSHAFLLDLLVDTVAPLGTLQLHPDSDTGIAGYLATAADRITSDKTPRLFGRAEANALVRVAIDGVAAGTTVAVPLDGDDGFAPPAEFEANYTLETVLNLDDGLHTITTYFLDVAGNETPAARAPALEIFVDTQGPRVTNVTDGRISTGGNVSVFDGVTSVFEPKPAGGPDPLIHSLVVHFRDGPKRVGPEFLVPALYEHLAREEGHYRLVGDAHGQIPIVAVQPVFTTVAGQLAWAAVELVFHDLGADQTPGTNDDGLGGPLPDDRYTLWVSDTIRDWAGNALDGESGASGPFEGNDAPQDTPPLFPSGDGSPGGSFSARLTVDSRPELATYHSGGVWVDTNGNSVFDPDNGDFVNRDIVYLLGVTTDNLFAGNFADPRVAPGVADGFDKLGGYGRIGSKFRWLIDFDNDGVPEDLDNDGIVGHVDPLGISGLPLAGNFDGNAANGDEVGLLAAGTWYFDANHNYVLGDPQDIVFAGPLTGLPVVGDFNGDGWDDLGTWKDEQFTFLLATGAGTWGGAVRTLAFGFSGVREKPVAADMDLDGIDDVGLWVPDRAGVSPAEAGEWYFLVSAGRPIDQRIEAENGVAQFKPVPFGPDLFASFGDEFAMPLVGNFDPPVVPAAAGAWSVGGTNPDDARDVNGDGRVTPLDALLLINELNQTGPRPAAVSASHGPYLDVTRDGTLSPNDALLVINFLNLQAAVAGGEGEASGRATGVVWPATSFVSLPSLPVGGAVISQASEWDAVVTELASARQAADDADAWLAEFLAEDLDGLDDVLDVF